MNPLNWIRVVGVTELLTWLKAGVGFVLTVVSQLRWLIQKFGPFAAVITFFATPVSFVLLDTEMWEAAQAAISLLQGYVSGSTGTIAPWIARINYLFPIAEAFMMMSVVAAVAIASVLIRVTKALIEFVLEIIPF